MVTDGPPAALRARANSRKRRFGRRRRVVTYDARYADGHVDLDVHLDQVLEGRRLPADGWATRDAANAACPSEGIGAWVEYATGRVLDEQP
jgi:hypothetical protein